MLEVTAELALEGGWDAVQMREVAQRADVALGTLYRYFPSKEYLLVSVMIAEIEGLADRLAVKPPEGDDPVERVVDVLRRANRALQRQPQVTVAMIRALVSGNTEIAPAVADLRAEGIDAVGPRPADTLFHAAARGGYDAALCMYHDQALIPLKTIDFDTGVNITLGLPFVRTSPDHGTALDIAGRGLADPSSMKEAIRLAARLARGG